MRIYTRTGDAGQTTIWGGQRVSKMEARLEANGTVDELNAALGLVCTHLTDTSLQTLLRTIQSELFDLGADLAVPLGREKEEGQIPRIQPAQITALEHWIDDLEAQLEPLQQFILPGGTPAAATLHLARTIARRAERRVVALAASEAVNPEALRYLNRLSDLLFVLARTANHQAGTPELTWPVNRLQP